jgi:Ca2+-binding EF-hand superfamily protein
MSFLNSLAKKPQVNATKIHYVSTTSGAKHGSLVGATPLVRGLPHEKKYGPGLEVESNERQSSVLFDFVLQTNKSNLANLLPNPMVKPPIARTKKLAKTAAACSRAKKRKTILNQNQCIFEIMQTWLVMIKLDRQLQNDLQDLTLRPDYSVIDLFRCNQFPVKILGLDVFGKGYITLHEFLSGLEKFDLHPSKMDASLLLKYFDRGQDGRLDLKEFTLMMCPFQREYVRILKSRKGQQPGSCLDYDELFSSATVNYIQKAFRGLLENAVAVESLRQRITDKIGIEPHLVFAQLDMDGDGKISGKDLEVLYKNSKIDINPDQVDFIVKRFDHDHDSKIGKVEFIKEFQPWSKFAY